jgi:beta-lactamase regulating signal transducer with metallopeptidase domain
MVEVFLKVLNMSITATYVLIAVLILRLLLKRAPKWISYILWGVLLFRLVCPVSFSSAFSLFNFLNAPVAGSGGIEYISKANGLTVVPQISSDADYFGKTVSPIVSHAVEATSVEPMQLFLSIGTWVWLAGIVVMLIYSVVSYLWLKRRVSTATHLNGNVFETDEISSPFVCGFFKPKIYLPVGINETEREYVLLHERTHILRKDHIIKPIAFFALSIHWFNPFMWLAFCLMSRDMEMSCDERVVCELDREGKVRYSETLLRLAMRRPILAGSPLAFGESTTKSRIKNVLHYKKPSFWLVCTAVLVLASGTIFLLTNPDQFLGLPDATFVMSVEMERFNEGVSVGSAVLTDNTDIEKVLSALSEAKKTLRKSVNDTPTQKNYVIIRLILEDGIRSLFLYSKGGSYYIEEPYAGVYKINRSASGEIFKIYTTNGNMQGNIENVQERETKYDFFNILNKESAGDDHGNKNILSREEIIQLVESIDPYQLKPTMSPKERYDLRTEMYSKIPEDEIGYFSHIILSSALQLYGVVSDDRYIELIDKNHPRWDAYDKNDLFGVVTVLSGIEKYVDYKPLQDDIDAVKKLCKEGLEERNILKIIDANRILQDLSRHLIKVPYRGEGEEKVDYGDIHNLYFKATKTLEGAHNFLSDTNIPADNYD